MQGRLIVLEGVEGCGKTTQLEYCRQWLLTSQWLTDGNFTQVVATREPGGTAMGAKIRQLLLGQVDAEPVHARSELLLFAADRAQHVEAYLRPQLAAGAVVLCDRYTDSTIAYQGYGRGLNLDLIEQLNQIATNGLESDLTLWLDLDVTIGLERTQQRGARDRIEQADHAFHARVQQGFTELSRQYPQRIVRIEADRPEADVAEQIQTVLQQRFLRWSQKA